MGDISPGSYPSTAGKRAPTEHPLKRIFLLVEEKGNGKNLPSTKRGKSLF